MWNFWISHSITSPWYYHGDVILCIIKYHKDVIVSRLCISITQTWCGPNWIYLNVCPCMSLYAPVFPCIALCVQMCPVYPMILLTMSNQFWSAGATAGLQLIILPGRADKLFLLFWFKDFFYPFLSFPCGGVMGCVGVGGATPGGGAQRPANSVVGSPALCQLGDVNASVTIGPEIVSKDFPFRERESFLRHPLSPVTRQWPRKQKTFVICVI